ncbi:MAG: RecX family transcriptional regulator [Spirochaetales bacterium]|nr:RecX family transcriptional regulator [Spirochaetales bacterium]
MHEEDSSSPRDNLYISGLKNFKGNKIKIIFSDGSYIHVLQDIVLNNHIYEGKELTPLTYEQLKKDSEILEAERYALSLLSFSQHSKKNLALKLTKRGFSKNCINDLIFKLEDLGYLDDTEFAKTWVASRILRHPEGKHALLAGLLKQGIERTTAEEVIQKLVSDETELDLAAGLYKKLTGLHKQDEKIAAVLKARGFSYGVVRKVMG